jgi:hypothetical protein
VGCGGMGQGERLSLRGITLGGAVRWGGRSWAVAGGAEVGGWARDLRSGVYIQVDLYLALC